MEQSITSDIMIVELANELSRCRALSDQESIWLERALRREDRRHGRQTAAWTKAADNQLRTMLKKGIRPAQIAIRMKPQRTPRAIYRRMYKLGLTCGKGSVVVLTGEE